MYFSCKACTQPRTHPQHGLGLRPWANANGVLSVVLIVIIIIIIAESL